MIIKCDAKQLEWRSYLELSRDAVGIEEVLSQLDIHSRNQQSLGLPSRLIAKVFIFRWIYRGPAYSYSVDPDFAGVSDQVDFWQSVIDKANQKYRVLHDYQNEVIDRAKKGHVISIPSGRTYTFEPKTNYKGQVYFSEPDITNYINQGFAADLIQVARRLVYEWLITEELTDRVKLINTVHDDIQLDVVNDPDLLYTVCNTMEDCFSKIPQKFEELYGYEFVVPFEGEVSFGKNLKDGVKFNRNKGVEQFYEN